jgi:16S rRNA (guanine966-N2)-methyltransferase
MRIISGFLKGKKMNYLKSSTTRPLRDFVKENTFNVIKHSNLINISLEDTNVLDFYSGVGSFGIECISRGAKKVTFVESDKKALTILQDNIKQLKIEKKSKVFQAKILSFLSKKNENKYEIIFFDPPFSENSFIEELKIVKKSNICKKDHIIIIHREEKSQDNFSEIMNIITTKKYGRSKVIFGNLNLNIL